MRVSYFVKLRFLHADFTRELSGISCPKPTIAVCGLDYRTRPCALFKPEQFQAVSMNQRFYLVPV